MHCGQNKLYAILFLILSVSFLFCKQKTDFSKEFSRLDSIFVILKDVEKLLLSVDTSSLSNSYRLTTQHLKTIAQKLAKDTLPKQTGLILADAYEQSKMILNLLDNKKHLEKVITESQQRINDLKHDLANNLIEKLQADEYIKSERNASEKICNVVDNAVKKAESASVKLDSMKTRIAFLADSLKTK